MTDDTTAPAATPEPTTTAPAPAPRAKRRWITPALAVVAALAIGVFGGILIGHNSSSATAQAGQRGTFGGAPGAEGGIGGDAAGGFTAGTIESIDGGTITLKLTDGSTVKVTSSDSTTVTTTDTASVSDLKKGETITVVGTKDASGNVTATAVTEGERGFGGTPPAGAGANG